MDSNGMTAITKEDNMQEAITVKILPDDIRDYLSKFDLNACFTCGTCTNGCPITGNPDMQGWDTRKVIRMLALGMLEEVVESKFPWLCTGCGRCAYACPMGLDIVGIMAHMKHLRPPRPSAGHPSQGGGKRIEDGQQYGHPPGGLFFSYGGHGAGGG